MRKTLMLLLSLTLVVMTARGVSASTDCQRWLADYKKALAEKASQPKLLVAKQRIRRYAHKKIHQLTTAAAAPAPHPTRIANTRPHLTPAQMLKKFELLCGDLPVDPAPAVLDARMEPDEFISEMAAAGPVDLAGTPSDDSLVADNAPPFYDSPSVNTDTPSSGSYAPSYGPIGGGGTPGYFVPPTTTIPPTPPIAPVPEPGTWVMVLSGGIGLMRVARRKVA